MCDHVWIFEARTLGTASPATMRHVRCIPDGTKVPRTGHIDMRTSGWRADGPYVAPEAACVPQTAPDRGDAERGPFSSTCRAGRPRPSQLGARRCARSEHRHDLRHGIPPPWVTMARRPALAAVHDHMRLGGIREIEGVPPGGRPSAA